MTHAVSESGVPILTENYVETKDIHKFGHQTMALSVYQMFLIERNHVQALDQYALAGVWVAIVVFQVIFRTYTRLIHHFLRIAILNHQYLHRYVCMCGLVITTHTHINIIQKSTIHTID